MRAWDEVLYVRSALASGRRHPDAETGVDGYPPLPPRRLMFAVASSADDQWFLEGGRLAYVAIVDALDRAGVSLDELGAVLDFGCGVGRVSRHWQREAHRVDLYGVDYNPALIAWCREHLRFGRFATNGPRPPLAFPDATFGLVYALSVFTHLPLDAQLEWRDELARVTRPGGLVLVTLHGDAYRDRLTSDERRTYDRGDVVVRFGGVLGANRCAAYHPMAAVRQLFGSDGWEIVEVVTEGAKGNPRQDLVLARTPEMPSASP